MVVLAELVNVEYVGCVVCLVALGVSSPWWWAACVDTLLGYSKMFQFKAFGQAE
jgi:hypothetical protein